MPCNKLAVQTAQPNLEINPTQFASQARLGYHTCSNLAGRPAQTKAAQPMATQTIPLKDLVLDPQQPADFMTLPAGLQAAKK